jgi:uncharacterized membrane protein
LIVSLSFSIGVDWDEAFTYNLVTRNNLLGIVKGTASDVHPPLFYFIAKFFSLFGKSVPILRLSSISGAVFSMVLGATLVRKNWGIYTATIFNFVMALAPRILYYNLDIRMYSWSMAFTLGSALFAYEIMKSLDSSETHFRDWFGLVLMSLGGVYTQYFTLVTIVGIYFSLLIYILLFSRKTWRHYLVQCLIIRCLGNIP